MKTKKMRKKALVASLAMLLVAVVALSGATYAWFSANTAANVSGLKLTTETSSTLLFSDSNSASATWTPGWDFAMATATVLVPASTTDGTFGTFYGVTSDGAAPAGNDPLNTIAATIAPVGANATGGGYLQRDLWVKSSTGTSSLEITNIATDTLASNIRVGIKVDGGNTFIFSPGNGVTGARKGIKEAGSNLTTTFGELYDGTATRYVDTQTVSTYAGTTLCALTAGTPQKLTIYVWLEGNDATCNDSIAGIPVNSIQLSFSA